VLTARALASVPKFVVAVVDKKLGHPAELPKASSAITAVTPGIHPKGHAREIGLKFEEFLLILESDRRRKTIIL
jgi:hypothetical protein